MTKCIYNSEAEPKKSTANAKKHGIAFEDIPSVFGGPMLSGLDLRLDYGEARWIAIGLLDDIPVVVAYTERSDRIRLISARKATRHEAKRFFETIQE